MEAFFREDVEGVEVGGGPQVLLFVGRDDSRWNVQVGVVAKIITELGLEAEGYDADAALEALVGDGYYAWTLGGS